MENTREAILEFVEAESRKKWAAEHKPYLLADVGPALKVREINYKELIAPYTTLKRFLEACSEERFHIVADPRSPARVGVIPQGESYDFQSVAYKPDATISHPRDRMPPRKYVVLNFLQALSDLSPEDLKDVQIPAGVLAKLLSHQ